MSKDKDSDKSVLHKYQPWEFFSRLELLKETGSLGLIQSSKTSLSSISEVDEEDDKSLIEYYGVHENTHSYPQILFWMFSCGLGPYIRDKGAEEKDSSVAGLSPSSARRKGSPKKDPTSSASYKGIDIKAKTCSIRSLMKGLLSVESSEYLKGKELKTEDGVVYYKQEEYYATPFTPTLSYILRGIESKKFIVEKKIEKPKEAQGILVSDEKGDKYYIPITNSTLMEAITVTSVKVALGRKPSVLELKKVFDEKSFFTKISSFIAKDGKNKCGVYHYDENRQEDLKKNPVLVACDKDGIKIIGDDDAAIFTTSNKLPNSVHTLFNFNCGSSLEQLQLMLAEVSKECNENPNIQRHNSVFLNFVPKKLKDDDKNIFDFTLILLQKRLNEGGESFLQSCGSITLNELVLKIVVDDKITSKNNPYKHGADCFNPFYDPEASVALGNVSMATEKFLQHMIDRASTESSWTYNDHPVRFHSNALPMITPPKDKNKKIYPAVRRGLLEVSILNKILSLTEDGSQNVRKEFEKYCEILIKNHELHMEYCHTFDGKRKDNGLINEANILQLSNLRDLKEKYLKVVGETKEELKSLKSELIYGIQQELERKPPSETRHL